MIKKEVIEKISKYFRLTEYEAEKVYDDIFSIIMNGVKEDNIVDIANFGEFIIKYNNSKFLGNGNGNGNGNGYKKTVEFLPSANVEEELNQDTSIGRTQLTGSELNLQQPGTMESKPVIHEETPEEKRTSFYEEKIQPPAHEFIPESSVEEELRRKREEILSKITGPILPGPTGFKTEDTSNAEPPAVNEEEKMVFEGPKTEDIKEEIFLPEITASKENENADKTAGEHAEGESEDLSRKSFSDYFTEVTSGTRKPPQQQPAEELTKEDIIPKSAVLLHNEILSSEKQTASSEQLQSAGTSDVERKAKDDSYYIWYKDSESNPMDTQTLSYEYELLYQATKEAEYKSKLKIYVSTFILFFSLVLVLLIFSPVLYKVFFSPVEPVSTESVQPEKPADISEQKGTPNVLREENTAPQNQTTVVPLADTNKTQNLTPTQTRKQEPPVSKQDQQQEVEQKKVQSPPVTKEEKKPEQQKPQENAGQQQKEIPKQQQAPQQPENKIQGLTKNAMGWMDEKLKVIYVQLENGKFTIQESAWDSDSKAGKRISAVESMGIAGIKGSVVKADLGSKGIWYRVRFGEFSTIDEARKKAGELRSKEHVKLQAMLLACLFLFT